MGTVKNRLAEERDQLGNQLPLRTPFVLVVDPSSICNLRCRFCPSGYDDLIKKTGRQQKVMDLELFQKFVEQLLEFPEDIKVLRLYKEGEPLVNPNFEQMVACAKRSKKIKRIDTTTNGLLFSKERNRRIIDAGIDQINISVNGVSSQQMKYYTNREVDFQAYTENIRDLYQHKGDCLIYIKAIQDNLTEEEQEKFFDIFGEISDRIFLERLAPAWPDFEADCIPDSFETGHYGQKIEPRTVCPYIFYTIVVNADGSVSSCVGDWKHEQVLGDIKKESLYSIWNTTMRDMWLHHLKGCKDDYSMCRRCKVITHGCLDNIDDVKDNILKILEQDYES